MLISPFKDSKGSADVGMGDNGGGPIVRKCSLISGALAVQPSGKVHVEVPVFPNLRAEGSLDNSGSGSDPKAPASGQIDMNKSSQKWQICMRLSIPSLKYCKRKESLIYTRNYVNSKKNCHGYLVKLS